MQRALVVVDMQNDYFPGGNMELVGMEAAATKVAHLLAMFRDRNWPILHIQHLSIRPGSTFFIPETEGVQIHGSVAPLGDEPVITKHYPNSFRETSLQDELHGHAVNDLVVCGAMSHMCIDTTVRAAFDLGFNSIVVADGCATRDLAYDNRIIEAAQVHGAFMAALGAVFARVTELAELEELLE